MRIGCGARVLLNGCTLTNPPGVGVHLLSGAQATLEDCLVSGQAAGGDYRNAVRNLYLAALLTLEQNGLVPLDRSLTNREVLRRIPPSHPVAGRMQPVVETFDEVWYGVHEPDDQTYRQYTQEIDALETLAQRPAQEKQP